MRRNYDSLSSEFQDTTSKYLGQGNLASSKSRRYRYYFSTGANDQADAANTRDTLDKIISNRKHPWGIEVKVQSRELQGY